jgi:hypothetical protein
MIDKNKNAFPIVLQGSSEYVYKRMTIRQVYFKAALQGLCSNYSNLNRESGMIENIVAMAFKLADTAIEFENKEDK